MFSTELMCSIDRLDFDFGAHVATLHLADGDCPHMDGAIRLCRRIDPRVQRIVTYSGARPDILYVRGPDGTWQAFWLRKAEGVEAS
jgi:hypothetical protein